MPSDARDLKTPILFATGAGLALRLGWWAYAQPEPVSDFEYIRRLAEALIDHGQFGYPRLESIRLPGYPFVLAGVMLISRSTMWLSFVTVLIATLLIPAVMLLTHRLGFSSRVVTIAGWLTAVNPTFVYFAPVLATEHLFVPLLIAAICLLFDTREHTDAVGRPRLLLAGACMGLATLVRADALFYLPVLMLAVWRRRGPVRARSAALLIGAVVIITPWYVRNERVIGPGAGISTSGGSMFYYGHNATQYGWHPIDDTPLRGLDPLAINRRGYELGFEYLREAGVRRIASDIATGTSRLYSPRYSRYALRWSTQTSGANPDDVADRPIAGRRIFEALSGWYVVILLGAAASVLVARTLPPGSGLVLYGLVLSNWVGYAWIFSAGVRFRYLPEVVFCVLTAVVIATLRPPR